MKAEYINHMGDDLTVVNAARVSFDKESTWEEVSGWVFAYNEEPKRIPPISLVISDKDKKLINYLARHNHWTPFSHAMITMRETVPIFVARQRFKHMVGFTYNEVSRRYVDDKPEFFTPDKWRKRAENKKQGSSDESVDRPEATKLMYGVATAYALSTYNGLLEIGVAPEQARMVLPQSMYTSYYTTGSLSAFARAYNLRSKGDSQKEIQELATQWDKIIRPLFPYSWSALTNGT